MAEAVDLAAPQAAPATIADAYDLGDTDHDPVLDEAPAKEEAPPAVATPSEPPGEDMRPRGPDGRFLPKEAKPEPIKHSSRLIRMAQDLGISEEEIQKTPSDQLDEVVYHLNKQALELAREQSRERSILGATERNAAGAPRMDPPFPPAPETETDPFDVWAKDAGLYPELLGELQRMRSDLKELKALKGEFGEIRNHHRARMQETLTEQLDRAFARHEAILGKGTRAQIKDGSPEHLKRMAVLGLVEKDTSKAPLQDKIDKVVKALYGSAAPQAPVDDILAQRREQWNGAGLAMPTNRSGGTEPKGDKKAMATAHRMMKEQGLLDEENTDGFLD